ncbi:histidine phosphatase family protein (plasmid) [Phyllobacterium sp. A18/5-2]|uniref:histidine phosphatase family protein n=1 Tax=Phyllobacterium sp. A18/5-2 TaxID=2978392 RepID=UPI0021C76E05|nr:histidine phosphatase family protein [Phyllobacterium sp. A18/5-2]UXN66719.1 histidine phosphatase family protein [Phyllobacterium sp. A18/5-2]
MRFERRQFLVCSLAATLSGRVQATEASVWTALRSGEAVALLRHGEAPGTGDPPDFRLGDCTTQRNLSAKGRAQAGAIGNLFRANGISSASVYSSQWCRCLDTARLLGLGEPAPLELLNSFFGDASVEPERTAALLTWLRRRRFDGPLLLVTHQVNITALTGKVPGSGEMTFARIQPVGPLQVIGRISAPQ